MAEHRHSSVAPLWGVSAEFDSPEDMLAALHGLRDCGLGRLDAFSPLPVQGAVQALQLHSRPLYPAAALGGLLGALAMFAMCTYATVVSYRFNIGGRTLFSWPSYVVPSVSFGAMTAALATVFAMLAMNRLPRLNHPAFNIPGFTGATAGSFFLAIEARDDGFDPDHVEALLARLSAPPRRISRVPR